MQRLDLLRQVSRHGRAMGLILRIPVIAEGFSFCVKYAQAIIRRAILTQTAQHVEHAVDRARRFAVTIAQIRHGMKRTVKKGRSVHQKQSFSLIEAH